MIYEVYAGGIHALQATLTIELSPDDRYQIALSAKTRGLLGKLAPWKGSFTSKGWKQPDGTYQPEEHESIATWRDETEVKTYSYNKDGSFNHLTIKEHDKPAAIQEPDAALTHQTLDSLTATLNVLNQFSQTGECDADADIFDGKRRFTQHFKLGEEEMLQQSRYNIFNGYSVKCTVEVEPKGGAWHKKPRGWMSIQEQGREKGTMPTIWMGQMAPSELAIPIKILVKTQYGTLFMHLAEYQAKGEVMVAEKRVTSEE